jgi:hypothetical protein
MVRYGFLCGPPLMKMGGVAKIDFCTSVLDPWVYIRISSYTWYEHNRVVSVTIYIWNKPKFPTKKIDAFASLWKSLETSSISQLIANTCKQSRIHNMIRRVVSLTICIWNKPKFPTKKNWRICFFVEVARYLNYHRQPSLNWLQIHASILEYIIWLLHFIWVQTFCAKSK